MNTISRRSFLIGSAVVSAIVIARVPLLDGSATTTFTIAGTGVNDAPILYSDGIHDDAPALNSLLSGGRAKSLSGVIFESPIINNGVFLVRSTILIRYSNFRICNSIFQADFNETASEAVIMVFENVMSGRINNCIINGGATLPIGILFKNDEKEYWMK